MALQGLFLWVDYEEDWKSVQFEDNISSAQRLIFIYQHSLFLSFFRGFSESPNDKEGNFRASF